jgi:hypothetical protein
VARVTSRALSDHGSIVASALLIVFGLMVPSASYGSAAASDSADRADEFRWELGYESAAEAFRDAPASPTSVSKWGIPLTEDEEGDLDRRADLQEKLGPTQEVVELDPDRFGGSWLDQRGGAGKGFVFTIGFVKEIDEDLLAGLSRLVPSDVKIRGVVVDRSMAELEAIAAEILAADRKSQEPLAGVSIAPQLNAVVLLTTDGQVPKHLRGPGVVAEVGAIMPTACTPADRCTLRPFRGGEGIQDKFQVSGGSSWWQCTSGFFARNTSDILVMITAAHCQRSYWDDVVYGKDHTDPIGGWGPDTTPPWSLACATYCDVDVEVQIMDNVTSYPASKNIIYYNSSNKSRAITQLRNYGSSWVGSVVCLSGVTTDTSCGTITMIGTACCVGIPKEGYNARINKGAFTTAVTEEGDSGGPVTNTNVAYGIVTAKYNTSRNLYFSSLSPGLSQLNSTLCTTAAC